MWIPPPRVNSRGRDVVTTPPRGSQAEKKIQQNDKDRKKKKVGREGKKSGHPHNPFPFPISSVLLGS